MEMKEKRIIPVRFRLAFLKDIYDVIVDIP